MSTIKGCIFDLDGVIVNTARYHYLAWKKLANELDFDFSEKDNESLKGVSRMESLEILLKVGGLSFDDETKLALAARKNQWYVDYINSMEEDEVLPGAKKFIERARAAGLKIALGSASKNALTILNRLKLADYFDVVIDGTKVSRAKPDPEIFLLAAHELGLPPSDCVVFEDAKAGVEAAKKAGMKCIGVGIRSELADADAVIPGFENIDLCIL
ncbi:MAG TPA: beta-phosphoglucomutase [Bacillota bacterium]|jgi:beta-phosphoglucomutase|nr:beta-phosphoglucomutase [Bacillota bacterium]HPL99584.1 beta-phosphoglucomutase [Bacillota bacterium]